ncbi:transferrin-binding protein-like solute binding protein [Actinobacillus equuli]|uniref:transferrin-binding protein-like solute binding protein n=1 Tax=Actinobacillus equuli TaxID=718 RepID=UPI0024467770|nr:transferrin-binding protein-like solute binding protein [Actinobacillus equuli]WGE83680.1 transferrin-binding protein-like solute binding protein [Actinobacillus equuli subsp. equuli]
MKKMTKLALTLLAGVVISACGSGGSGSSAKPQNEKPKAEQPKAEPKAGQPKAEPKAEQQKAEPKVEKPKAEKPLKPETIKITTKDSGKVFVSDSKRELSKFTLTDPNLAVIDVDGFKIPLSNENKKENLVSYNYTNVRFGIASDEDKGNYYSFYNGKQTTEIPVSGIAKYSGDVVLSTTDGYAEGNAVFDADFGKKVLSGTFSFDKNSNAELSNKFVKGLIVDATISGNSFAGTVGSSEVGNASLEGKFYGENAKQLAGAFDNAEYFGKSKLTSSWGGAFGAKKQQ